MTRHIINALLLSLYGLRLVQAHHIGVDLSLLYPYIGAWMGWIIIAAAPRLEITDGTA